MEVFGMSALFGLILGFMFGVGCAAAVIYTVYMGGYKKAVADSFQDVKSKRYLDALRKVGASRAGGHPIESWNGSAKRRKVRHATHSAVRDTIANSNT